MADRLLEDLGIAEYMETVMCDRSTSPYSPSVSGWNSCKFVLLRSYCSILWYCRFYGPVYSHDITINFRRHIFNLTTMVS